MMTGEAPSILSDQRVLFLASRGSSGHHPLPVRCTSIRGQVLQREVGLIDWKGVDGDTVRVTTWHDTSTNLTRVRLRLSSTLDWSAPCPYLEVMVQIHLGILAELIRCFRSVGTHPRLFAALHTCVRTYLTPLRQPQTEVPLGRLNRSFRAGVIAGETSAWG